MITGSESQFLHELKLALNRPIEKRMRVEWRMSTPNSNEVLISDESVGTYTRQPKQDLVISTCLWHMKASRELLSVVSSLTAAVRVSSLRAWRACESSDMDEHESCGYVRSSSLNGGVLLAGEQTALFVRARMFVQDVRLCTSSRRPGVLLCELRFLCESYFGRQMVRLLTETNNPQAVLR